MFSIWSISSFLYSPHLLAQGYRNCAELQKRFNDKNPEIRFQNFEKVEMQTERSMPFQSVYATAFFCDGGTYVMRYKDGIKRSCNGYIVYYVSPYSNDQGLNEHYYSGWGKYRNRWIAEKMENRCHQIR